KLEINTKECFKALPLIHKSFSMKSDWFSGACDEIVTYELVELAASKLRALYQRRKGRDLFDMWDMIHHNRVDINHVIDIFLKYCAEDGTMISKKLFQENMEIKRASEDFKIDMSVLLPHEKHWNFDEA